MPSATRLGKWITLFKILVLSALLLQSRAAAAEFSGRLDPDTLPSLEDDLLAYMNHGQPPDFSSTDLSGIENLFVNPIGNMNGLRSPDWNDLQAPPLSSFHRELFSNFKGLFDNQNLHPLLFGAAVSGGFRFLDSEVQEDFSVNHSLDSLGSTGSVLGSPITTGAIAGGLLLASYRTDNQRFRSMSFALAQGYVMDYALVALMKTAVPRSRPDLSNNRSFPSGHTSVTFMMATVVSEFYPKAALPAYALAGLVGASRIENNKHWLTDTIAGATLGYIIGKTVIRGTRKSALARKINWMPYIAPKSAGLALHISF